MRIDRTAGDCAWGPGDGSRNLGAPVSPVGAPPRASGRSGQRRPAQDRDEALSRSRGVPSGPEPLWSFRGLVYSLSTHPSCSCPPSVQKTNVSSLPASKIFANSSHGQRSLPDSNETSPASSPVPHLPGPHSQQPAPGPTPVLLNLGEVGGAAHVPRRGEGRAEAVLGITALLDFPGPPSYT